MNWEAEEAFNFDGSVETEMYSCNTRKDKDKRLCRHSFGVLFGCWPCGIGNQIKFLPKSVPAQVQLDRVSINFTFYPPTHLKKVRRLTPASAELGTS